MLDPGYMQVEGLWGHARILPCSCFLVFVCLCVCLCGFPSSNGAFCSCTRVLAAHSRAVTAAAPAVDMNTDFLGHHFWVSSWNVCVCVRGLARWRIHYTEFMYSTRAALHFCGDAQAPKRTCSIIGHFITGTRHHSTMAQRHDMPMMPKRQIEAKGNGQQTRTEEGGWGDNVRFSL